MRKHLFSRRGRPADVKRDVRPDAVFGNEPGDKRPRTTHAVEDIPSAAPVLGDVREGFESHLVARTGLAMPSIVADGGRVGDFWVAAASLAGLRHLHRGDTGQDAYAFRLGADGRAVIAVADGLGESRHTSQLGAIMAARLVCGGAARRAAVMPTCDAIRASIEATNAEIKEFRRKLFPELADEDLSTTLAVCVITPVASESAIVDIAFARVGDCAAFTLQDGDWTSVFARGTGAANVVTACIPSDDTTTALEIKRESQMTVDAVLLATDGLAEDIHMSAQLRAWLAGTWGSPVGPYAFLDSLRYRRKASHDDRTAAVIWPLSVAPEANRIEAIEQSEDPTLVEPSRDEMNANERDRHSLIQPAIGEPDGFGTVEVEQNRDLEPESPPPAP